MKAVTGFLFLLVGVTVAWLVVSGKLPAQNPQVLFKDTTTGQAGTQQSVTATAHPYTNVNADQGIPLRRGAF